MVQQEKKILPKGLLIVFEGIDGTGKSTQLRLLADHLMQKGYSVVKTKEPTDGHYGKQIKNLYVHRENISKEEELDLFLRDRWEHVEKFIRPCLAAKKIILCDRYYLSTIAYQGAAGLAVDEITRKNSFAPQPDIALLFQLSPQVSTERITKNRGETLNDFEQEESLEKVASIFNSLTFPFIRPINADQPIEAVHEAVVSAVETLLDNIQI